MAKDTVQRRLAAILAADVVGWWRLMGADEAGTLARLKGHREALIDPKLAEFGGRIVKTTGDGVLVEFSSAVDHGAEAEANFEKALAVARGQKARAWELRAATALARLYHDSDRTEEGRDLLGPLYAWFKEGLESADLRAARAQL
ncbi:MAG TPA: hypothetical protein QF630_05815, partial [Alphaproteobacteria bacterium]|nr:hypothetical protein [Alphaproteobacteria bacterium]